MMETKRLIINPIRESDKEAYFYNISHDKKVLETFVCQYTENLGNNCIAKVKEGGICDPWNGSISTTANAP